MKFFKSSAIFLVLVIAVSCEEEVTERNYPRLNTLPVSHISEKGARFNAEIIFRGDFSISRYGFIWGPSENLTVKQSNKIEYQGNYSGKVFSADITGSLQEGATYYVKSFLVTDDYTVYGKAVEFYSLGSSSPVIHSFSPEKGSWGDTLVIKGKNFNYAVTDNKVKLGEAEMKVISASDTMITAIINPTPNLPMVELSVEIYGNRTVAEKKFIYNKIVIDHVAPMEAAFGDTIQISASNFNSKYLTFLFGEAAGKIISIEGNLIHVAVPAAVKEPSPVIIGKSAGLTDTLVGFKVKKPVYSRFFPQSAAYGDTVVIEGVYLNPDPGENEVLFEDFRAIVVEANSNMIKAVVPDELNKVAGSLNIRSGPYQTIMADFTLKLPTITSITPESIEDPGQVVEIKGENFNANRNVIKVMVLYPLGDYEVSNSEIVGFPDFVGL